MRIEHQGESHPLRTVDEWRQAMRAADPARRSMLEAMVNEGLITDDDGKPLPESVQKRVKARLLGTYADAPRLHTFGEQLHEHEARGGTRFLIPDLWPEGGFIQLGGNPKAGKTAVVADLCAALLVPERRFLDYFEPATLTDEERGQGLVLINTEVDSGPMLDELEAAGITEDDPLVVVHLRDEGGASLFDLTDPYLYDMWAERLPYCEGCLGDDDQPPFAVIVDNLTAVLQDVGKPLEHYGELLGKFVHLMLRIDCPSGLTVVHNTLGGRHSMGGVTGQNRADGLWNYWSTHPDNPVSPRYFSVSPRGKSGRFVLPTRVLLGDDGRLRLKASLAEPEPAVTPATQEDEVLVVAQRTADYVREHPGASGQELTDNVDSGGWKQRNLEGRTKAVDLGLIREERCGPTCSVCERPHHRRLHYWPPPD